MIIVTHEMDFALSVSDRVVMMEHGVIQLNAEPTAIIDELNQQIEYVRMRKFMGGSAVLDVFTAEPLPAEHPLWS